MKDTFFPKKKVLNVRGKIWSVESPVVMGILNLTPDSFYDGGKHNVASLALEHAAGLIEGGASIVDIGAFSSRPGAVIPSAEEEWNRLKSVIKPLKQHFPHHLISIDTFRSEIAKRSLEEGADIINDISGGSLDPNILKIAAEYQAPFIAMHMQGTPETMQQLTDYPQGVTQEVIDYFIQFKRKAWEAGLTDLILDPGFGFAKNQEQNYELMDQLERLKPLQQLILVGISRKSMIYKSLNTDASAALNGTTALHMAALYKGADILRVHDVKEALESITLYIKLRGA